MSRWEGLTRFIDDGRIELDDNTVERSTRASAAASTPASTVTRHPASTPAGFNKSQPFNLSTVLIAVHKDCYTALTLIRQGGPHRRKTTYLTDVFTRIVKGHPNSDIDQLLPWAHRKHDLRAVA